MKRRANAKHARAVKAEKDALRKIAQAEKHERVRRLG